MPMIDHKFIGKEYPPIKYEIGREKLKEYARAVGDMKPIHHDEKVGAASSYGDIIATPSFAAVYALLGARNLFFDPEIKINMAMLVHGEQEFEWYRPARPGDVMTVTGKITEIYEKKDLDFVVYEARAVNQEDELVCVARATFVIRGGG